MTDRTRAQGSVARFLTGAGRFRAGRFRGKLMLHEPSAYPLAYLITFTCYGTWLHGEEKGSVDDQHNRPGTPFLPPDVELRALEQCQMDQPPYLLDEVRRTTVRNAIVEVCRYRDWTLSALHVRGNHAHAVVAAAVPPEKIMNDFKAYASRALNEAGLDDRQRKRWTRHGSTRYLWYPQHVASAVAYVLKGQGEPMATYP